MGDVNEEKACCNDSASACCQDHTAECCTDKADANCCGEGVCEVIEIKPDHWANVQEYWDTVHEHLDKAASDVRAAVTKGVDAAEPVFREKVAPVLADATAKLAELADSARKTTSEKAGFTEDDNATSPTAQIGAGLAAVATGLLGLSKSLTEWLSHHATTAAEKESTVTVDETVVEVPDVDIASDVTAVADLLQQPVYVADGETKIVEPNEG